MNKTSRALLLIRMMTDVASVELAWLLAFYLRFYTFFEAERGIPGILLYVKLMPFIAVIWLIVFFASGFYRRTVQRRSAFMEAIDVLQSCALATLTFIAFTYFYDEYRYSRGTLLMFAALHPMVIITCRSLIRKALRRYRRLTPARRTLIVGSGSILHQAFIVSESTSELIRNDVVSLVLIGDEAQQQEAQSFCKERHIACVAEPENWPQYLATNGIQQVILALPHAYYQKLEEIMAAIVDQVANIRVIPDIMRYTKFAPGIELAYGVPIVSIHESPLAGLGSVVKRMMDIAGALVGLLIASPVMLIAALMIKASSRGPVFYRQERMGLDGIPFEILKFRTMPVDAEKETGAVWARPGDGRATWLGGFLRKSSLDELPQLINILRGDMSLVGPRPERPVFVSQFRHQVPGYMLRHKVKAGLTGWAQVNGWRGNTSLERRIECDLFYIQNWSVGFDLRIILLTVIRGFFSKNAY